MLLDEIRHDLPTRLQGLDGVNLIISHQDAVSFDIGTHDGPEFACDFSFCGHWITFIGFVLKEDDTSWKGAFRPRKRSGQKQIMKFGIRSALI
jgi:hypothetical protein